MNSTKTSLPRFLFALGLLALGANANDLSINQKEYFEKPGFNLLVFSNAYEGLFSDAKISGVEIIHHGVRTATNGDVRLHATPEQWDINPVLKERKINRDEQSIEAFLHYPQHDFNFSVKAIRKGEQLAISVNLPKPLPKNLEGKAGFNLEFLPSAYFHKSFLMDDTSGYFPVYPGGLKEISDKVAPVALAKGNQLTLAPEDNLRRVQIQSNTQLELYDGRGKAQNGWFVVRSLLPANKTGSVLEWTLSAATEKNWLRPVVL